MSAARERRAPIDALQLHALRRPRRRRGLRRAAVRRSDRPLPARERSSASCSSALQPMAGPAHARRRHRHGPRGASRLAAGGAVVTGVDASREMLEVARARAAAAQRRRSSSTSPTRTRCRSADRSFDAAVCLRVLMHATDWRRCVAELCRVSRWRVVVDFPARGERRRPRERVAPPSPRPLGAQDRGVSGPGRGRRARARLRRTASASSRVHRQFVLPIALHKAIGRLGFTTRRRARARGRSACCACWDRPSRWWPSGEGARHRARRDSPAVTWRRLLAAQGDDVRALVRDPRRAAHGSRAAGIEVVTGDLHGPRQPPRARRRASTSSTTSPRCTARPVCPADSYRAVNADGGRARSSRPRRAAGVRRVVHCSTVGVHGDIEHPPANEDAPLRPGDVYQETKLEGERLGARRRRATGIELVIARPSGIYGPGDRRLFKLFGEIAQRPLRHARHRRESSTTSRTSTISARDFGCAARVPAAAGRTYILAGAEVTTLAGARATHRGRRAASRRRALRLPVWPVWLAGAACEAGLRAVRRSRRRSIGAV